MDPLVSVDDLSAFLQRDLDRSTADVAVAAASGAIRAWCHWPISPPVTETWQLDGNGTEILALPTLYLADVTSVTINGVAQSAATGLYPRAQDFSWTVNGQLYRAATWPNRFRSVEVVATHGYPTTPDGVTLVGLALAARLVANPEALGMKVVGATTQMFASGGRSAELTEMETRLLDRYRLR